MVKGIRKAQQITPTGARRKPLATVSRTCAAWVLLVLGTLVTPQIANAQGDDVNQLKQEIEELRTAVMEFKKENEALRQAVAAATPEKLAVIEGQIDALAGELERLRLGNTVAKADTSQYGLGQAASKVYRTEQGLSIGGYGEVRLRSYHNQDDDNQNDVFDALRAVLYVGYKFNDNWIFNSEIEFEHGSTSASGSASLEFATLDYLWKPGLNLRAGLLLAPRGIGVIIAMAMAARLMNMMDARILLALGWAICAWSCYMMIGWSIEMDWWPVFTVGVIQGLGIGFIFVPLNVIAFATLPVSLRPEGAALMNLARNVGASVGISITASNVARAQQISHADLGANITPSTLPSLGLERLNLPADQIAALVDNEINRQALMIGYLNNFWLIMWGCIIAVPAAMLLKKIPPTGTATVEDAEQPPDGEPQPAE